MVRRAAALLAGLGVLMDFGLLGPLTVRSGDVVLPVRRGKQRAVLAALLLDANRTVPVNELAETLWGTAPPPSAQVTVQNYVKRLRHALGDAGRGRVSTQPRGYLIRVEAGELDVSRFEAGLAAALAAARDGSWLTAAGQAREALSLWRGEPLADVESEVLMLREVPRLAEMRLRAVETSIDADLHLGRQAGVIAELERLVTVHPLRERLHVLLMLALYRDGQRAEALAAYQYARRVLLGELGAEPGAELRRLQQQVLAADPGLAVHDAPRPTSGAGTVVARQLPGQVRQALVPRQLPAAIRSFVGRGAELAALTGILDDGAGTAREMVIVLITGTAGVGKTALAVHWAHRAAAEFPDGQLFVSLRGFDPSGTPVTSAQAVRVLLDMLQFPAEQIPQTVAGQLGLYRSLLAGKRMLVVLDNAHDIAQVRPLLPGSPTCQVIVTSRSQLTSLAAIEAASPLTLDVLSAAEARQLLEQRLGASRLATDPRATAQIIACCAQLPLALSIIAARAAMRPDLALTEIAADLTTQPNLDAFADGDDPAADVRAAFSWSYRQLAPGPARVFRLAGLHPGPGLERHAVAALAGLPVPQAARFLDVLTRAGMIQPTGPGRYGMHDLLRGYARELAASGEGAVDQRAALTGLLDYYLDTATDAAGTAFPADRRPALPAPATGGPEFATGQDALAWLNAERGDLAAMTAHAAGHRWPSHAIRLSAALFRYLETSAHTPEAVTIHGSARRAARDIGDQAAEAAALNNLGGLDLRQGHYQQAAGHLEQALELYRQVRDPAGQARTLSNLGFVDFTLGRCQRAIGYLTQSLDIWRGLGNQAGEARTLGTLGEFHVLRGEYPQAASDLRQALVLSRQAGDRGCQGLVLGSLGDMDRRQGRYEQAATQTEQALTLLREIGDRVSESEALATLGLVRLRQGDTQRASDLIRQSLAVCAQTGDLSTRAFALNSLGEVLLATGRAAAARAQHATALEVADQAEDRYEQARAHEGLATTGQADGAPDQARQHWQEALTLYTELGAPEADRIRG
jgi:DNA-binding SARP family transcriptional activator/Tfp pilus assembly protein PilF